MSFRHSNINAPISRNERYDNSFLPYCIKFWNNLVTVKSLPTLSRFKDHLYEFIRPKGSGFYGIHDKHGIKLITKIRIEFSDLRDHRCNHNFNCLSPICSCGIEDETSENYLLSLPRHQAQRTILLSNISETMGTDVSLLPKDYLIHIILFDSDVFNTSQ